MTTLTAVPAGVSTLDYPCARPTIPIDTGPGNTAVGYLDGIDIKNCAVFRPRVGGADREEDIPDPERELWAPSGQLVSLLDQRTDAEAEVHGPGYRTMAENVRILRGVARRVRFYHDWVITQYLRPDDPDPEVVVEVPEGIPRGYSAFTKSLTLQLAAMIALDLDCDTFATSARLCVGTRHQSARNPTGKPVPSEWCYPQLIRDRWPDWGEPGADGQDVPMGLNEDVGKRGGDELELRRACRDAQQVFDIGKFWWMRPKEREPYKLPWRKGRGRRRVQTYT